MPLLCLTALCACGHGFTGLPYERQDPSAHEVFLLAISDRGEALMLERITAQESRLALFAMDGEADARRPWPLPPDLTQLAAHFAGTGAEPPTRESLTQALLTQASPEPALLAGGNGAARFAEVTLAGHEGAAPCPGGTCTLSGDEVRWCEGGSEEEEDCVVVERLGSAAYQQVTWLTAPARNFIGLEVAYAGSPRTRAAYLLDLPKAQAELLARRARNAHRRGELALALPLWQEAMRLQPRNARLAYGLACTQARLGEPEAALVSLEQALILGGRRALDWARADADLAPVLALPDFFRLERLALLPAYSNR